MRTIPLCLARVNLHLNWTCIYRTPESTQETGKNSHPAERGFEGTQAHNNSQKLREARKRAISGRARPR